MPNCLIIKFNNYTLYRIGLLASHLIFPGNTVNPEDDQEPKEPKELKELKEQGTGGEEGTQEDKDINGGEEPQEGGSIPVEGEEVGMPLMEKCVCLCV